MKNIFEQGVFSDFKSTRLDEATKPINELNHLFQTSTTVFISHKHEDLEDLMGLIGFLEKTYGIKAYIDSRDSSMPKVTSGVTATNIKSRISACDKFILLATNAAIESKWCNWELGFGDAKKYKDNIALFPMKPKGDYKYKGNEYMEIYPYIVKREQGDMYSDGSSITPGYYVRTKNEDSYTITPLEEWFDKD